MFYGRQSHPGSFCLPSLKGEAIYLTACRCADHSLFLSRHSPSSGTLCSLLFLRAPVRDLLLAAIAIGVNAIPFLVITWINVATVGYNRRAVSLATVNAVAQVMSIISILLYKDSPRYLKGNFRPLCSWNGLSSSRRSLIFGFFTPIDASGAISTQRRRSRCDRAPLKTSGPDIVAHHPDFFFCL